VPAQQAVHKSGTNGDAGFVLCCVGISVPLRLKRNASSSALIIFTAFIKLFAAVNIYLKRNVN
jgi:hypothetical protein